MNTDQKYMFEASIAVKSGYFPITLANMKPGKLHNVRWLTLANRILRLYVSTVKASKELCDIVYFLLNLYVLAWFFLKQHWKCVDRPKNLHYIASLICLLPPSVKDMIIPVFCNTQGVERHVKLVTEASEAVYGRGNRNGWILNTIAGREKNPFFTKSNFKV